MIISKPQTDQSSAGNKHGHLTSETAWELCLPVTVMLPTDRACTHILYTAQHVDDAATRAWSGYYGHILKREP